MYCILPIGFLPSLGQARIISNEVKKAARLSPAVDSFHFRLILSPAQRKSLQVLSKSPTCFIRLILFFFFLFICLRHSLPAADFHGHVHVISKMCIIQCLAAGSQKSAVDSRDPNTFYVVPLCGVARGDRIFNYHSL